MVAWKSANADTVREKRLAYRIQELAYLGLSARAEAKLRALAEEEEEARLKGKAPRRIARPIAGTRLAREWKRVEHHVTVLDDGFEYQGRKYTSLSAIARAITGTRWNGPTFWGSVPVRVADEIERLQNRCAVYTRKSSEEGLEMEFNSLDAQREAAMAYIQRQKHEGWILVGDRYDDGGTSGGTLERPALQRLLWDVECGVIDVVGGRLQGRPGITLAHRLRQNRRNLRATRRIVRLRHAPHANYRFHLSRRGASFIDHISSYRV